MLNITSSDSYTYLQDFNDKVQELPVLFRQCQLSLLLYRSGVLLARHAEGPRFSPLVDSLVECQQSVVVEGVVLTSLSFTPRTISANVVFHRMIMLRRSTRQWTSRLQYLRTSRRNALRRFSDRRTSTQMRCSCTSISVGIGNKSSSRAKNKPYQPL